MRWWILALGLGLGIGCGSSVIVTDDDGNPDDDGPTPDDDGPFPDDDDGTGAFGGSSTGGFGGTGGTGGEGGVCAPRYDGSLISVSTSDGEVYGCFTGEPGVSEAILQGVVIESSANSLTIDTCPLEDDCETSTIIRVDVESEFFFNPTPYGAFVEVSVFVDSGFGCTTQLLVKNLPGYQGYENLHASDSLPWLAVADGTFAAPLDSNFSIAPVPLGCPGKSHECGVQESYSLVFDGGAPPPLDLRMGEVGVFWIVDGNGALDYTARNLRSFETGLCDDFWNWGYSVTRYGFIK